MTLFEQEFPRWEMRDDPMVSQQVGVYTSLWLRPGAEFPGFLLAFFCSRKR